MRKLLLIMKITTLLLVAVILHVSAATSLAQKVTLNEKNVALIDVFNKIRVQTGYDFAFSTETLENSKPVTINVKNEELNDVLTLIFRGQNLEFSLNNKIVTVKPKETGLIEKLTSQIKAELAQVTVTGKVVDETGQPLLAVTVKIKSTGGATTTDSKGQFSITVPDNNAILVFSSVGYETQELAAKDIPNNAAITLKASVTGLSEVQVLNKGYYFEKKELTTGDVSVVSSKTIGEQPVFDPLQALEGQVSGVNIQQPSGNPGAYSTIHIRGLNSIANGTEPLFLIDGVPFNSQSLSSNHIGTVLGTGTLGSLSQAGLAPAAGQSPFSAMNMDDIESIEVLKDADATAIYGSRGANGVILITTKKGKPGETKVNIDLSQGIGQVGHFMDLLNSQQYLQMRHEAFKNDGLTPSLDNGDYDLLLWDTTRYTNWQKTMIGGTAHYTDAQASISGGTANTQFYISGGYNRQTTVYPGDYEDRKGSLHFTLNHASSDQKFHVQLTAGYVNDNNLLPTSNFTSYITLAPNAPAMRNPNGSINWQLYNGTQTWDNPIAGTLKTSDAVTNNLISRLELSYQLFDGLTLKVDLGYNNDEMNQVYLSPAAAFSPPNNTNASYRNSSFSTTFFQTWIIEPQMNYRKKIAKGTLNVLLGGTLQQNLQQNNTELTSGYSTDALLNNPAAANPANTILYNVYTQYRYSSVYARVGYDWAEKYLLNITASRDGSSRFGPANEFGNFGSVGAGWIFSKEKVIADGAPWLSFGKLRANYGITGNDQITDYQYLSTYNVNSVAYQSVAGLAPTNLSNPYFGWEVLKKLEGGIDLGFLQDRIDLSVNYYRNRTGNQLVGYPLTTVTGFTTVQYNLPAVVQNTGLEVQLTTVNFKNKDFSWTTSINFTLPENKLISYPGLSGSSYKNRYVIGQSIFSGKVYQYTGVNPQTGQYTYATANANGTPSTPQDLVSVPGLVQKYYGGIQNNFTYKNFGLAIFIQFVNQTGYSYLHNFDEPGEVNMNEPTIVLNNHWTKPGDLASIQPYSTNYSNGYGLLTSSTASYTDASFVRLKNASLYYKLPVNWQKWAHMQNAQIYVQGQNLYTLTKYIGLDPETQGLALPPLRVIMAGVSASF